MSTHRTAEASRSITITSAQVRPVPVMIVLGMAELMVTLDNSIMNIALPSAQTALDFDDAHRSWVITAYALAFGSLLLPAGRIGDLMGRKWALLIGLIGFALSSVFGGFAPEFTVLVAARALQGTFAALMAPAALALLTTTFPEGRWRTRAFGIFATFAVSGASLGMLLGGALTAYLDWRACLFVNAVFAAAALLGGIVALPNPASDRQPGLDLPGLATAAAGCFCLVYGFAAVTSDGWTSPIVLGFIAASAGLFTIFLLIERRVRAPLMPLHVALHRYRGAAFLTLFVALIGMFAVLLFVTYLLQRQFGFSPLLTGVAFLPMTAGIVVAANVVPGRVLSRTGPRLLMTTGLLLCAGSLFWLSFLTVDSSYVADVLGPLILLGLGLGAAI